MQMEQTEVKEQGASDRVERVSPDWVRISMAAAIELGLKPGRISGCRCGCINLLQNYPEGCFANCSYCGLARHRPGLAEDNSFIRVSWPLFRTDEVAAKIGEVDRAAYRSHRSLGVGGAGVRGGRGGHRERDGERRRARARAFRRARARARARAFRRA